MRNSSRSKLCGAWTRFFEGLNGYYLRLHDDLLKSVPQLKENEDDDLQRRRIRTLSSAAIGGCAHYRGSLYNLPYRCEAELGYWEKRKVNSIFEQYGIRDAHDISKTAVAEGTKRALEYYQSKRALLPRAFVETYDHLFSGGFIEERYWESGDDGESIYGFADKAILSDGPLSDLSYEPL